MLHRDVSGNNIMINGDHGVLNDWDLSRSVLTALARQRDRTVSRSVVVDPVSHYVSMQGTWQFISTLLLMNPRKGHEISDDLESAFFVLLYYSLHHVKHNKKEEDIDMEALFDNESTERDVRVGGDGKEKMYVRDCWVEGLQFLSKPLTELFWDLHDLFGTFLTYKMMSEAKKKTLSTQRHLDAVQGLSDCQEVLRLFKKALDRNDWPERDRALSDQFPLTSGLRTRLRRPQGGKPSTTTGTGLTSYLGSASETTVISSKRGSEYIDGPDDVTSPPMGPVVGEDIEHVRKKIKKLADHLN